MNRKSNNIIEITKKNYKWRTQLPAIIWNKDNKFLDENNKIINPFYHEIFEQYLMYKWIKPDDIVLELGSRYGIISCTINSMLNNKKNHVVVDPDKNILKPLKLNKKNFKAEFKICNKAISNTPLNFILHKNGIGNFTVEKNKINNNKNVINIPNITSKQFFTKYPLNFNVLIADCEGCLFKFFNENMFLLNQLNLIIFEKDNEENCDYNKVIKLLKNNNFIKVDSLLNDFQQVWIKK